VEILRKFRERIEEETDVKWAKYAGKVIKILLVGK